MTCPAEIVVSGMGVWSGAGTSVPEFSDHLISNRGPRQVSRIEPSGIVTIGAPDPPVFPGFPQARRMDRSVHLALAAASQAYTSARLESLDPTRIAILVGNSRGPVEKWMEPRRGRIRPTQAANTAVASLSGALSLAFQIQGPCLTLSAACASSAHAIALGAVLLQTGEVDAVLAGGAEAPRVEPLLEQFQAAGLLGSHDDPRLACRPFDSSRNGIVPGEGAAFLVLETARHATTRHGPVQAVLAGYAMASEAHNRVATRADGAKLRQVIGQALERGAVRPDEIGYINAHGTGTWVNDAAEAAAFRSAFGAAHAGPPVSSTKAVTGHTFGAAAALEAVIAVEALRRQVAPPTWGCKAPDPTLDLDLILEIPRPLKTRAVLSTSLGFWGNTAALVFRSPS